MLLRRGGGRGGVKMPGPWSLKPSHLHLLCGHGRQGQHGDHARIRGRRPVVLGRCRPARTVSDTWAAAARACSSSCRSSAPKACTACSSRPWRSSRASAAAWSRPHGAPSSADRCSRSHEAASAASAKYCGKEGGLEHGRPRTPALPPTALLPAARAEPPAAAPLAWPPGRGAAATRPAAPRLSRGDPAAWGARGHPGRIPCTRDQRTRPGGGAARFPGPGGGQSRELGEGKGRKAGRKVGTGRSKAGTLCFRRATLIWLRSWPRVSSSTSCLCSLNQASSSSQLCRNSACCRLCSSETRLRESKGPKGIGEQAPHWAHTLPLRQEFSFSG